MSQVPGDLLFRIAPGEVSRRCLHGMSQQTSEFLQAIDLKRREFTSFSREERAYVLALPELLVAGNLAAKHQVREQLLSAGRPVPFLHLKAETIEFLRE